MLWYHICTPFYTHFSFVDFIRFDHVAVNEKACGKDYSFSYFGDYSSDAEFFVAAGVLAMLYALGSLAFYCFCSNMYQTNKTIPLVVNMP